MHFLVFPKTQNWQKNIFRDFEGKTIFLMIFLILSISFYLIYYTNCFYFLLKYIEKQSKGCKKSQNGPKLHFLPPRNISSIVFSKKVKTLLHSKSGIRRKIALRKSSKKCFFPQNLTKKIFAPILGLWKKQKMCFGGSKLKNLRISKCNHIGNQKLEKTNWSQIVEKVHITNHIKRT